MAERPILIDPVDGPCEFCSEWDKRLQKAQANGKGHTCAECGDRIPKYRSMRGNGFVPPRPHHFHLVAVMGAPGREPIYPELCLACYQKSFAAAYPDTLLPEPPMLMEPAEKPDPALDKKPDGILTNG